MCAVLLSPLGKTDWREADRGPVMRILVEYADITTAVLYLSAEMVDENQNTPFAEYINSEKPGVVCEIVERPELVDVHHFDVFYNDLGAILGRIHDENPDQQIYVNLSSGTPAFKSTLMVLAEISPYQIIPLQVDDPRYSPNDNDLGTVHVVQTQNFRRLIIVENIKKLVDGYSYIAARSLGEAVLDEEQMQLLDGLVDRYELRTGQARIKLGTELIGSTSRIGKAFEYIQYLCVLKERQEWANYLRATDPAVISVLLCCIEAYTNYTALDIVVENTITFQDEYPGDNLLHELFAGGGYARWHPLLTLLHHPEAGQNVPPQAIPVLNSLYGLQNQRNTYVHNYQVIHAGQAGRLVEKWDQFFSTLLNGAAEKMHKPIPPWDSYNRLNQYVITHLNRGCAETT